MIRTCTCHIINDYVILTVSLDGVKVCDVRMNRISTHTIAVCPICDAEGVDGVVSVCAHAMCVPCYTNWVAACNDHGRDATCASKCMPFARTACVHPHVG